MKLTQILYRQHLGRHIKRHWRIQGVKKPHDLGTRAVLEAQGINVVEPEDILKEKRQYEKIEVIGFIPKPLPLDETHPNWHERICYTYNNNNVLLEGLNQAKILTNTVEVKSGLPDNLVLKDVERNFNSKMREIIRYSHIFDAEQQKLPKIKDPLRPAFNFPRVYGITEQRVKKLLISKILNLIEVNSDYEITKTRSIFNDLTFSYPFVKKDKLIQFELKADTLLTSSKPLKPIYEGDLNNLKLPDIYPSNEVISLNKEHIYEIKNVYPLDVTRISNSHPHTLFIHYNTTEVSNLFEEQVLETQIFGRNLLKAFTIGASYGKRLYGEKIKDLSKPIVLQCIQTNGKWFNFGILQINTLDLLSDKVRNVWFQSENIELFNNCGYVDGKPTLEGYNSEVIKHILGFYNNM
nr:39S ribosomal protein L37, mitochondrial [Onthophagus taurus]